MVGEVIWCLASAISSGVAVRRLEGMGGTDDVDEDDWEERRRVMGVVERMA